MEHSCAEILLALLFIVEAATGGVLKRDSEFCKIFKNIYFEEDLRTTLLSVNVNWVDIVFYDGYLIKRQPNKMFDHIVGLALKRLLNVSYALYDHAFFQDSIVQSKLDFVSNHLLLITCDKHCILSR